MEKPKYLPRFQRFSTMHLTARFNHHQYISPIINLQILPQFDQQFPRQGNDPDPSHPAAAFRKAPVIPAAQGALRLVVQPRPGNLNRHPSHRPVAGLADPAFLLTLPALIRCRCQSRQPSLFRSIINLASRFSVHSLLLCELSLFVQCGSTTFLGAKRPALTKPLDLTPHIIYTVMND